MASTYSSDLKLELITTGEKSGTWGTITNTNLQPVSYTHLTLPTKRIV